MIEIDKVKRLGYKPKLLLHACCGPCSTYPIELLSQYFELTIYFNNSNIYPEEEYNHRLSELIRYVDYFNKENNTKIDIVKTEYDNENYMKTLSIRADDKENGPRCKLCYALRMKQAYFYAKSHNFDYFSTVMTMSRQKDQISINNIGRILEKQFQPVKFLPHNFKKKGGQERRDEIVSSLKMYDQKYCGCIYSYKNKK